MIISIRGKDIEKAADVTALLSAMTAVVKSKKTLALQLTGFEESSVIDKLVGRILEDNRLNETFKMYQDDGIDAISVRSETMDLTKEHFDQTVTSVLEKQNLFDVLKPTNKKEFYDFVKPEFIKNLLSGAKAVYDYIYVLLPENISIIKIVNEYTDENIVVVPQGPVEQFDEIDTAKTSYIIEDYESESIYKTKIAKKGYGTKRVFELPHNYQYRDALIQQTLFDFVRRNKSDIKEDDNYTFTASVMKLLTSYVSGKDEEEDETEELPDLPENDAFEEPDNIDDIPDDAVQEITVKKGIFGKKEKRFTADL